ncbi:MarR family winged helix-turn-helix transcriptional regulator [Sphingobium mellinum]|uniref:MarR family winged helix-turn-helix transcriptional regulator n=1 Tax=Sphingobium mellinum TaxID=1387166 RepID=UPI0030EF81A1
MKQGSDLQALVGYQIQRAHLIMEADARTALSSFNISPAKLTALILIRENPGSDQTALGRAMSVNRSSAMKLVNILVDRKLIERRPGRDLRTNALHLLPEGETLVTAMLEGARQSDARMTARLTSDEVRSLLTLLRKLGPETPKRKPVANRRAKD